MLVGERIIVKDLAEDLYDGQVLQKLFGEESVLEKSLYCCSIKTQYCIVYLFPEKLEGEKLNVAEMTQCEIAQKQKLQTVLEKINDTLKVSSRNIKWNVDCMYCSFGLFSLWHAVLYCSLLCFSLFATRTVSFILSNTNCGHWVFH